MVALNARLQQEQLDGAARLELPGLSVERKTKLTLCQSKRPCTLRNCQRSLEGSNAQELHG
eukprot:scaffold68247_cov15-Tisochrysis_lutea.AAC.1